MAGLKGVVKGTELVAARKLISFSDSLRNELARPIIHRELDCEYQWRGSYAASHSFRCASACIASLSAFVILTSFSGSGDFDGSSLAARSARDSQSSSHASGTLSFFPIVEDAERSGIE